VVRAERRPRGAPEEQDRAALGVVVQGGDEQARQADRDGDQGGCADAPGRPEDSVADPAAA
jgi:hypothetical protein